MYLRPSLGIVLITLTCLQVFGLYLFLKGFLLTRQTFPLQGHSYDSWDRFPVHQAPIEVVPTVIQPKQPFKRTVIILIDALRFDFVLNITNPTNPYYLNQFPILQQLYDTQPKSSLLFQFRADPPTTTMQRVKGIMTGSLPTFIDAGSNFASSAVGEDHLLNHIKSKFKNIYFFGDDTWVNLFPDTFNDSSKTFESDSFKMLDLDSVDNDILKHIWPVMENDTWEVALAHFLGVDHCGHTYGPSDPNMSIKLNQMNRVIEKMLNYIDKDTLLVVMGDHGMSVEGDHGGESVEELMSTLFLYSPRQLTMDTDYYRDFFHQIHQQRSNRLGYDIESISKRLSYDASKYPIVAQIHLVPTLAYLLQVPIPFGNLGAIIPDVIYPAHDTNTLTNLLHIVQQFRINALQVFDYLNQYADQTHQIDFSKEKLNPILQHLYTAEEIMVQLINQPEFLSKIELDHITLQELTLFDQQLKEAILSYDAFLISTIKYCEAIWAQFDTGCMFIGIVLLGVSTFVSFWMMMYRPYISYKKVLGVSVSVFTTCLICTYVTLYHIKGQGWFEKMENMDWIGASVAFTLCCLFLFMKSKQPTSSSVFWYTCDWYLLLIADIAQSFTLGSNSYVIWEDRGTLFVLGSLSVCWMLRNLKALKSYTNSLVLEALLYPALFLILVRIISFTGQCREEQFPDCNYIYSNSLEFGNHAVGYFSVALIFITVTLLGYLSRWLPNVKIMTMYLISGFIVVLRIMQEIYLKNSVLEKTFYLMVFEKWMDVYLPRVVYGLCLIGTCLCFKYNKVTIGWTILLLWSTVLAIVQRPLASMILLGSPVFIGLLNHGSSSSLLIRLGLLHFLGHHLFFVTGHQATFVSLPWKAAFVGFDEMNYYGGMILVTLSTMAGYIISWFGMFILLVNVSQLTLPLHLLTLLQSIPTFLCAIFILILRRHLMTWKIFAPRFLVQILIEVGAHLAVIALEKTL